MPDYTDTQLADMITKEGADRKTGDDGILTLLANQEKRLLKLESAATTTPPPTTDPTTPTTPTSPSDVVYGTIEHPLSKDSPWNQFALPTSSTHPLTAEVRRPLAGTNKAGINWDKYSAEPFPATEAHPLVKVFDRVHGFNVTIRIPPNASPVLGTDSNLTVVQPNGISYDLFQAKWTSTTTIDCNRIGVTDIKGKGIGPATKNWTSKLAPAGVRAAGCSLLGGLITASDVASGRIRHALAMNLPGDFMLYTGVSGKPNDGHLDDDGFGIALGYDKRLASEQDAGSQWGDYKGKVPMGSPFAIPKSVDIKALGFSPEAYMVAEAAQTHGVWVADISGTGNYWSQLYASPDVPSSWIFGLIGADWGQIDRIRQLLCYCPA